MTLTQIIFVSLLLVSTHCSAQTSSEKWKKPSENNVNQERTRSENTRGRQSTSNEDSCDLKVECRTDNGILAELPVQLPIRGPEGPPGRPGSKGERGSAVPEKLLKDMQVRTERKKVAFFVGLSSNFGPFNEDTDVVFDSIVTNTGASYQQKTGHFIAPYNGTYIFTVVLSPLGKKRAAVSLIHKDMMVFRVWAESIPFWSSATNTAALHLIKDDHVWLRVVSEASHLHGYMYTTFTGYILFTD